MLQSLLEILLEGLPVNLAGQKGRLGHMAVLRQGNLVHEDSKLTGSQLKAESLEPLSQLLHINAWLVPAKKKMTGSTCFCQSTRLITCGRTSSFWQSTNVKESWQFLCCTMHNAGFHDMAAHAIDEVMHHAVIP